MDKNFCLRRVNILSPEKIETIYVEEPKYSHCQLMGYRSKYLIIKLMDAKDIFSVSIGVSLYMLPIDKIIYHQFISKFYIINLYYGRNDIYNKIFSIKYFRILTRSF